MGRRTQLKVVLLTWLLLIVAAWACQHIVPSVPSVTACPGYLCEGFTSPDLPGAKVLVCASDQGLIRSFLSFLGLGAAGPADEYDRAPSASASPSRGARWQSIGPVGLDGGSLAVSPDAGNGASKGKASP